MAIRPDMIGIVVNDMGASLRFYRLLGLDIPDGVEGEGFVEIRANGYRISWNTVEMVKGFDPEWTPPTGNNRLALAFLVDSPAEVDAVYQRLIDAGYRGHKAPWDAFWGQRYAQIADPDGMLVDVFAPLPQ